MNNNNNKSKTNDKKFWNKNNPNPKNFRNKTDVYLIDKPSNSIKKLQQKEIEYYNKLRQTQLQKQKLQQQNKSNTSGKN